MDVRRVGRILRGVVVVWALGFAAILATETFWPRTSAPPAPADAIVCLGAGMSGQVWNRPDPVSERRALTCAGLQLSGAAPVVVFTGYGHELYSAGQAMADAARAAGVAEDAIRVDPVAQSTFQNAGFALDLLPPDTARVIVVSDAFHLPRAWAIFRMLGVRDVALHAVPETFAEGGLAQRRLTWSLRESFALWLNLARGAAYGLGGLAGLDRDTRIGWFN